MSDPIYITDNGAVSGQDSTQAILTSITQALSNGRPVCIPAGEFFVESDTLNIVIPAGKTLTIFGWGPDSKLKRNPGVISDFNSIMDFTTDGLGDVDELLLYNFFIDSNAVNNPIPEGQAEYFLEHCADIKIYGDSTTSRFKQVTLSHLLFTDPIADCVYFAGTSNSYVQNANIDHMDVLYRNRSRSDITVTGGMEVLSISDCNLQIFEMELNSTYSGGTMVCNAVNVTCKQDLDIIASGAVIHFDNIRAPLYTFRYVGGTVSNSIFWIDGGAETFRFSKGLLMDNCIFMHSVTAGAVESLGVFTSTPASGVYAVKFKTCRFLVDSADTAVTGELVNIGGSAVSIASRAKVVTVFDDCFFDDRADISIRGYRCGTVRVINCDLAGNLYALKIYGSGSYATELDIVGCDFDRVAGAFMYHQTFDQVFLKMRNLFLDYARHGGFSNENGTYTPVAIYNDRTLYSTAAPTGGGYVGDRVKLLTPVSGQVCEWMATTTHPTAAVWKASKTLA